MKFSRTRALVCAQVTATCIAGCSLSDRQLVELAERSAARQAEQNQHIARQSQQVTETTRALVEADAQARREMIAAQCVLQEGLQTERQSLDRGHDDLEKERQSLATARHREPVIASAITSAAVLGACLLPVVLAIYLLRVLSQAEPDGALGELLIQEFVSDTSVLLPSPALPLQITGNSELPSPPADSRP
jgi:hypothetical protein